MTAPKSQGKSILNPAHDEFERLSSLAEKLKTQDISENTRKAYQTDFATFADFCLSHGKEFLPADEPTVCAFLASIIQKKYSTISRFCVSIKRFHNGSGLASPTDSQSVKQVLKGIRRENGISCDAAKPILLDDLIKMVDSCDRNIRGRRNQAVLLLGWSAALRRSEICALNVEDLTFSPEGLAVKIRRSKTDQEGKGTIVFIPRAPNGEICCVRFLEDYKELLFLNKNGPLFRRVRRNNQLLFYDWGNESRLTEQTITDIVKDAARSIGLSPLEYSAHSLRRGFATQCGRLGIPERFIARQTRHASMEVLRKYIDDGSVMLNNPLSLIYTSLRRPYPSPPLEFEDRTLKDLSQFSEVIEPEILRSDIEEQTAPALLPHESSPI